MTWFVPKFLLYLILHVPFILQRKRIDVLKLDTVSAQMIDIAVFGDRDKPSTKGHAAARIKFFDVPNHFLESLLRQILGKRRICRGF